MNRARMLFRSLPTALALACWAPATHAAWPHDPYNGNVGLCTATGGQEYPTSAPDGAGGAIVVWQDYRTASSYDIYVQRVNAAGLPQWTANGVALCTAASDQNFPTIVADGAGGAIVTWFDYRNGGVNADIYVQRVNAAGAPQWTANGVALCLATGDQVSPQLASDGAGGAIVTWYDLRVVGPDIYAQRVNAAGSPQWTANGVAVCTATSNQVLPTIAADGAAGAVITWYDLRGGVYDIYAQRVNASGAMQWTANGVAVCTAASEQRDPVIASDGSGGAIVAWYDLRGGVTSDIFAQRLNATGTPQWTANGVGICTAADNQNVPMIAADGAGGALIAWQDNRSANNDVYAQRVSAGGIAQWAANGVALCTATANQLNPAIVSDGAGGAIVSWHDLRAGAYDVYAQRVSGGGVAQWTVNGALLCAAAANQQSTTIVSDGAGGAIVAWHDQRNGNFDIYAQRVERFGQLGNPEPAITGVSDVPNDQGGHVQVQWTASYLDAFSGYDVASYSIWRRVPNATAIAAGAGARFRREVRQEGAEAIYWEFLASQPARGFPGYSYVAATTSDSLPGSNPRTSFMVLAEQDGGIPYWSSAPDSGYSVDNLAPAAPAPFTGHYAGGTVSLHWGASPEGDFDHYALHRGTTPSFVPGPGNLVTTQPDTGYADAAGPANYYKLAAIDLHGNVSAFAVLAPEGVVATPASGPPGTLSLGPPQPNPARNGARFRFALPRAGAVNVAVFDPQGRRVRVLVSGVLPAGDHAASWDGCDQTGRPVPSGPYFCRLEAAGRTLSRRVATIR